MASASGRCADGRCYPDFRRGVRELGTPEMARRGRHQTGAGQSRTLAIMRSFLFIPGDSPKKLDKGMGSGADVLLLDLEDSISPTNKAEARATTLAFLKEAIPAKQRPRIYVRINGLATGLTD